MLHWLIKESITCTTLDLIMTSYKLTTCHVTYKNTSIPCRLYLQYPCPYDLKINVSQKNQIAMINLSQNTYCKKRETGLNLSCFVLKEEGKDLICLPNLVMILHVRLFDVYNLSNRLTILNNQIEYDWLNKSLNCFKLLCKSLFLT